MAEPHRQSRRGRAGDGGGCGREGACLADEGAARLVELVLAAHGAHLVVALLEVPPVDDFGPGAEFAHQTRLFRAPVVKLRSLKIRRCSGMEWSVRSVLGGSFQLALTISSRSNCSSLFREDNAYTSVPISTLIAIAS